MTQEDRNALVCANLGLALRIARHVQRRLHQAGALEDLRQWAFFYMLQVADLYDSTRGKPFAAFAWKPVCGAVWEHYRRRNYPREVTGVEDRRCYLPTFDEDFDRRRRLAPVLEAMADLTERERRVVALYYGQDLFMREIGEHLGLSENRISQLHEGLIAKLRSRVSPPPTHAP